MPRPVGKTTYLPGLDGLRTIAVVSVLLYHLSVPHFSGGLLGVGVFFTLSGFLITSILIRQWDRDGHVKFGQFWLRRFRRLLPAVIVVVCTVLLLTAFLDRPSLEKRSWEALSALFYYNNWYEIFSGNSYFDMFKGAQPFEHMWSLAVEEQFYLVWPLLFTAIMFTFRKSRRSHSLAAAVCLIFAAASAILMSVLVQPGLDHTRVYEGTDTRSMGLFIGSALAFVWKPGHKEMSRSMQVALDVLGMMGLLVVLGMVMWTKDNDLWLYHGGFVVLAAATALVLIPLANPSSVMNRILGITPLRWLGERSYGIYLWHMPVIAFAPKGFVKDHLTIAGPVLAAISIMLAAASWALFEDPIRRDGPIALWKRWWSGQGAHSPAGAASKEKISDAAQKRTQRGVPPVLAGVTSVVCLALISAGLPKALVDGAASTSKQNLTAEDLSAGGLGTGDHAPGGAATGNGSGDSPNGQNAAAPAPADGSKQTSCSTVIHIGDSTSIALDSENYLPDPQDRIEAQYRRVGAQQVVIDIKGARAVVEHYQSDPNSAEVVQSQVDQGYSDACWVVALGTNDAANVALGSSPSNEERIRMILDIIKDQPHVLWPTLKTLHPDQSAYDNSGMQNYDDALKKTCKDYPNLRIYDWASEVQDSWYIDDGIHPNSEGAKERAHRFADALAKAFPKDGKPVSDCMVGSQ